LNTLQIVSVNSGQEGVRLDIWLARQLKSMSRSRIQQLIRAGLVTVNSRPAKDSHKTKTGERVEVMVPSPQPVEIAPENIPLDILFEDDSLLVINKPSGMVVHPAPGHVSGTLVNAVLHHCPNLSGIGGEQRPGIVHRLDRDTSGVILVAKTGEALQSLADQFKRREIDKTYLAVVHGVPEPGKGRIETLIGRHASDRKKMTAAPRGRGRIAISRYETLEKFGKYSLVQIKPETGRTHQIRVHLAHLKHPVAGDRQYGKRPVNEIEGKACQALNRQLLHAHEICFNHPVTGEKMHVTAPLPEDMARLLKHLRQG